MAEPDDEPEVLGRHLLICHTIWYTADNPDAGYSLGRVVMHLRPADGGFPFEAPRLFAFFQLYGTPGEYETRIELVRIEPDEDGDEEESEAGTFGPWDVYLSGESFVEPFAVPLVGVPFDEPGVFEFQLWVTGQPQPVARERVLLKR